MNDEVYQHLCTILLGIATLFRYAGYGMASFIVESVLHSAHLRDSSSIISHAGFYGRVLIAINGYPTFEDHFTIFSQAVREISMCITSIMVPIFFHGPKVALSLGTLLFCCYTASFLLIGNFFFFSANVLTGLARSLTHIGIATYMMQFSTKETLARNSARICTIAGSSLTIGASLYVFIAGAESDVDDENKSNEYRYYSEEETRFMFGVFTGLLFISFIMHCFLPNRQIKDSVESKNPRIKQSPVKETKAILRTMIEPSMLKLIPVLINQGIFQAFAMGVYPTSLQFSAVLSKGFEKLTAYYAYAMFAGNIACGVMVDPLSKFFRDFGLRPIYFITLALELVMVILCWLTVPAWSTARPTNESALITPKQSAKPFCKSIGHVLIIGNCSLTCVLIVSFLCGFIDSTSNAANSVYCSRILPGRATYAYAAARFYIGTSSAVVFFCSPFLSMTHHAIVKIVFIFLAGVGFVSAANGIDREEAGSKIISHELEQLHNDGTESARLTTSEVSDTQ